LGVPYSGGARRALADLQALRPSGAMVAGATALAVAAAGGRWLGGASREDTPAPAGDTVVAIGALQLELESTWVRAESVPGLPVGGAVVVAPAPGLSERALVVTGRAADSSLIPAALRAELPAELPEPRRATLAGLPAWTYGPLRDEGRMLEVTVAPTTAGVVALACSAPTASWSAWLDCGNGVHTVAAGDAKTLVPTAELAFRQAAAPVLLTLDAERVAARARLSARRPAAATALARAHRVAAAALAPFATAGAPAGAVTAMRGAARGYDALAAAARHRDRTRFVAARAQVSASDAALDAALARLRG
jgi:hypothetical protein